MNSRRTVTWRRTWRPGGIYITGLGLLTMVNACESKEAATQREEVGLSGGSNLAGQAGQLNLGGRGAEDPSESEGGPRGSAGADARPADTPEPRERNFLPCDVESILESRCRVCHSASGNEQEPLLETWTQVRNEANFIIDVISDDFMPMVLPPLTAAQKEVLRAWVSDGSPAVRATTSPVCSP